MPLVYNKSDIFIFVFPILSKWVKSKSCFAYSFYLYVFLLPLFFQKNYKTNELQGTGYDKTSFILQSNTSNIYT